jgi:hypothetical protein
MRTAGQQPLAAGGFYAELYDQFGEQAVAV